MSIETNTDFESPKNGPSSNAKAFTEKEAEDWLNRMLKASEGTINKNMYDELRDQDSTTLKKIIDGEGARNVKAAARVVLQEKEIEEKNKPKKPKKEHSEAGSSESDSGQKSGKKSKREQPASNIEFGDESVTSEGDEASNTPPELSQSEAAEFQVETLSLDQIVKLILDEQYKDKTLSPSEMITSTAGRLVVNIIRNNARPKESRVNPNEETDQQKLKRQMESAAFDTASDVQREFNRINNKAERIVAYANEKAAGNRPTDTDSTVVYYGREAASYIHEGAKPNEAYGRVLVNRISEKLDNSLSVSLGRHLQ